ncbi:MAG: helix-turn-helix domain-containing protein [Ignavibacteriales bacterium]
MKDFFSKEEYTEQDINNLISNKAEETINLDFKSSDSLGTQEQKKKELAKDVSSFANSEGGIIVYGIRENNHVAESLSFIDGSNFTKEWIEQVIHSNIHRKIDGVLIIPVRFENDVSKTVYVIKIPESNQAPHMTSDKRYYRRYNFESVPMEEYEVRNLYNRLQKTDLSIVNLSCQNRGYAGGRGNYKYIFFEINVLVKNESNSIEDRYKLEIKIPNFLLQNALQSVNEKIFLNQNTGSHSIFSIPNESPLFQDAQTSIRLVSIRVTKRTFDNPENFIIKTKLYFSNGIKSKEFDLLEVLQINGEKLAREIFSDER